MGSDQSRPSVDSSTTRAGEQALEATVNAVAAQVFDNVHSQLNELQKEQMRKTDVLAGQVKEKLDSHASVVVDSSICAAQMDGLVECLKKNKDAPLNCSAQVEAYTACSLVGTK